MKLPLGIDLRQIFLHLFNFAILTGGLYFLLYSPIKKFIEKREEHYRGMDNEASEKLKSAEEAEIKAKSRLENIESEISENKKKAEAELDEIKSKRIKEAEEKAEKIIRDAKETAEEEKNEIIENANREIIDMTKAAAEKIVHASLDEAYEEFLSSVERKPENDE